MSSVTTPTKTRRQENSWSENLSSPNEIASTPFTITTLSSFKYCDFNNECDINVIYDIQIMINWIHELKQRFIHSFLCSMDALKVTRVASTPPLRWLAFIAAFGIVAQGLVLQQIHGCIIFDMSCVWKIHGFTSLNHHFNF